VLCEQGFWGNLRGDGAVVGRIETGSDPGRQSFAGVHAVHVVIVYNISGLIIHPVQNVLIDERYPFEVAVITIPSIVVLLEILSQHLLGYLTHGLPGIYSLWQIVHLIDETEGGVVQGLDGFGGHGRVFVPLLVVDGAWGRVEIWGEAAGRV